MRFLFIHQNFPGQFKLLAPFLASTPGHQVVGMGAKENLAQRGSLFSFPVIGYPSRIASSGCHHYLSSFEAAIRRGQDVARACMALQKKGYVPDIVIGHPGWGEMLFVRDVFPEAKLISYFEFMYGGKGRDFDFDPEFPTTRDALFKLRIRNSTQLHALTDCDAGISPTEWQRSTYPAIGKDGIRVIHEGFDLEVVRPDANAVFKLQDGRSLTRSDQVVTYVSRQLEPYRGFHVFMRALPELQQRLVKAQFVIVGGSGVSYGRKPPQPFNSYREMLLEEVGSRLDLSRIHFVDKLAYPKFISLMQISRLHIYLTYPFVLSWSMLEAMGCGATVLASSTAPVKEFIRDGENGFLFDFFSQQELVERAVDIMQRDNSAIGDAARQLIATNFSFSRSIQPKYQELINSVISNGVSSESI